MSDYTEQELEQMQQDVIRRVREMQERARRAAEQGGWAGSSLPAAGALDLPGQTAPRGTAAPALPSPRARPTAGAGAVPPLGGLSDLFRGHTSSPLGGLMQWAGGERGILLALLAVLMGEGADPTLLLALFYLAMFDDSPQEQGAEPARGTASPSPAEAADGAPAPDRRP